jgi:hypothetical protein
MFHPKPPGASLFQSALTSIGFLRVFVSLCSLGKGLGHKDVPAAKAKKRSLPVAHLSLVLRLRRVHNQLTSDP